MGISCLSHLECPKCLQTFDPHKVNQVCLCGSPLLVRYDMKRLSVGIQKSDLINRPKSLWRYREHLPVQKEENIVTLGEGMTPLIHLNRIGDELGGKNLFMKDEGIIPTGSFKARGATVGVTRAKELGVKVLAMPTNGNAGGAWAAYCARAGLEAYIIMPEDAPALPRNECVISGAKLYLVRGLISDAGKIVGRAVRKHGWYDASTLREPYRIEGKKTIGLEIAEQFGWGVPDVIIYPTGGGVGLIGIHKGLEELREIGWIKERMPRLVSVQATGCAPIVKAWNEKKTESEFWDHSATIAFGINVPKALGDFLVLDAIYKTNGCAVAVEDDQIMMAQARLATQEGIYACPEGAATLSAAIRLYKEEWIKPDEKVLLLNTGAGLKYPEMMDFKVPSISPSEDIQVVKSR